MQPDGWHDNATRPNPHIIIHLRWLANFRALLPHGDIRSLGVVPVAEEKRVGTDQDVIANPDVVQSNPLVDLTVGTNLNVGAICYGHIPLDSIVGAERNCMTQANATERTEKTAHGIEAKR